VCDLAALRLRLAGAAPGETVKMGSCRIVGSVTVPPGVILAGEGPGRSTLAPDANVTVCLEPGSPATTLRDVTVEASAVAGVAVCDTAPDERRVRGLALEQVTVAVSRGWGVYVVGVGDVSLRDVTLTGPVDADNKDDEAFEYVLGQIPATLGACTTTPQDLCSPGEMREVGIESCPSCDALVVQQVCDECERWATVTATEGLVLRNVILASVIRAQVEGFAKIGVTVVDSELVWTGGRIEGNLGAGLFAERSRITMSADAAAGEDGFPRIERTFSSTYRTGAVGAFVTGDGSRFVSDRLLVRDNLGYGIVHVDATALHTGLAATRNAYAAVWAGGAPELMLEGSSVVDNGFAGVVLSSCEGVTIRDTTISGTDLVDRSMGEGGSVMAGDGLHMRAVTGALIERVRCEDNDRVGILLDLGGGAPGVTFSGVTVSGTGGQLGAVAGPVVVGSAPTVSELTPVPPGDGGWDAGIVREGATEANDRDLGMRLQEMVNVPLPPDLPRPDEAVGIMAPEC
jgi:hypothetical protein